MSEIKYTQEQIDKRTSDYVCNDCGSAFLVGKETGTISTFNRGTCGLCGSAPVLVTHIKAYNWLKLPVIEELTEEEFKQLNPTLTAENKFWILQALGFRSQGKTCWVHDALGKDPFNCIYYDINGNLDFTKIINIIFLKGHAQGKHEKLQEIKKALGI